MKILLIEDEKAAAQNLSRILTQVFPDISILGVEQSVIGALNFLNQDAAPDLIFADIQLSDGLSFEIFEESQVRVPVIFTTAYDEYALRAFSVYSVDYLLKPISPAKLQKAVEKFRALSGNITQPLLQGLSTTYKPGVYKRRFLIKIGNHYQNLLTEEIHYFYKDEYTWLVSCEGKKYPISKSLDELEKVLHPENFFRANRQFIVHINGIDKIHQYFKGRLKVELKQNNHELIISSDKASVFKAWMDN